VIVSSRATKILAAAVAAGIHGAFAAALVSNAEVEIEGASGAADVRLGSSFADMAAGTLPSQETAQRAEPAQRPVSTDRTETRDRAEARRPERLPEPAGETAEALRPETARAMAATDRTEAVVTPPDMAATGTAQPAVSTTIDGAAPVARADMAERPPETVAVAAGEAQNAPSAPRPSAVASRAPASAPSGEPLAAAAARPEPSPEARAARPADPAKAPERLEAEEDDTAPPVASPRPRARPQANEARPETPRQAEAQAAPQGNAARDARAGQAAGREAARAVSSGAGGNSRETGNAAASNYRGEVMRELARVRRPSVDVRGAAVVAFRVADNGGLAGLALARSSGSARLDRAALEVVQRAAPFPPPPRGAQRSFTIEITGR